MKVDKNLLPSLKPGKKKSPKEKSLKKNPPKEKSLEAIQASLNTYMTLANNLHKRSHKRIKQIDSRLRQQEKRFRAVLKAIINYSGDDPVVFTQRLCEINLEGGTKPGTIQWSFTSRILDDPKITGFCDWCGINCYGSIIKPEAMPCNVPGCPFEAPKDQKKHLSKTEVRRLLGGVMSIRPRDIKPKSTA